MKNKVKTILNHIKLYLYLLIYLPQIIKYKFYKNRNIILKDILIWSKAYNISFENLFSFIYLMRYIKSFRNLFYYRVGGYNHIFFTCQPYDKLIIDSTSTIEEGLLFYHPYSTIINAEYIGRNCVIRHLTTIGNKNEDNKLRPSILDNVNIGCNVTIVGKIIVGRNCTIGAGTVLTKSIPDNCTVVGNPARIIKLNGIKVTQIL